MAGAFVSRRLWLGLGGPLEIWGLGDVGTGDSRSGSWILCQMHGGRWNLARWQRSCLAQPLAKGSQASGLNAMGCSTFKVVWGWGDEMKRAKARTTSGVTGTQRKSVGASELSRRDRRSLFGGDLFFSGESFGPRGGWRTSRPTGHALASAATGEWRLGGGNVVHAFSVLWVGGFPDKLLRSPEGNREQRTEMSFGR